MIKILFVIITFLHGFIHSIGFVKEWGLAEVKGFTGITLFPLPRVWVKFSGFLWLLTLVSLVLAGVGVLTHKEWWWMAALAGVILSQSLIIVYWKDAKWGTLFNIFIVITGVVWFHMLNETLAER